MDIEDFLDRETQQTGNAKFTIKKSEQPSFSKAAFSDDFASLVNRYQDTWQRINVADFQWQQSMEEEIAGIQEAIQHELQKEAKNAQEYMQKAATLLKSLRMAVQQKNFEQAVVLYEQAKSFVDSVHPAFSREKQPLETDLFSIYQQIQQYVSEHTNKDARIALHHVENSIVAAKTKLQGNDIEGSKFYFREAYQHYQSLPDAMMREKLALGKNLFKLYKEISIYQQIKELKKQLGLGAIEAVKAPEQKDVFTLDDRKQLHSQHLIKNLAAMKLRRAKAHVQKGFFVDARKDIEAILKLSPDNAEAKALLEKMPQ